MFPLGSDGLMHVLQPMKLFLGISRSMKNILVLRVTKLEQTPKLHGRLSDSRLKATTPSLPLTVVLLLIPLDRKLVW